MTTHKNEKKPDNSSVVWCFCRRHHHQHHCREHKNKIKIKVLRANFYLSYFFSQLSAKERNGMYSISIRIFKHSLQLEWFYNFIFFFFFRSRQHHSSQKVSFFVRVWVKFSIKLRTMRAWKFTVYLTRRRRTRKEKKKEKKHFLVQTMMRLHKTFLSKWKA